MDLFVSLNFNLTAMSRLKILVLLVLACILFDCKQKKESVPDRSQEIDSLLTELRHLNKRLDTLNIHKVQYIYDSLKTFYDTTEIRDTLIKRHQLYIQSRNMLNWYDNINSEINFSRSHLNALKTKFKRNDIRDSAKLQELKKEKQIIASIKERFNGEYESLRREVRALLNRQPLPGDP